MMQTDAWQSALDSMRNDSAIKNKKGIAFILASIFVWGAICFIHLSPMSPLDKNKYTWFAVACFMPLAFFFSKRMKLKLQNNDNPLNHVGFLFTLTEILYMLIVCWVHSAIPEKMLMVLAMIFGGHLLPFGWLYRSKSYTYSAVIVTVGIFLIGCCFPSWVVALSMTLYEMGFALFLYRETKSLSV